MFNLLNKKKLYVYDIKCKIRETWSQKARWLFPLKITIIIGFTWKKKIMIHDNFFGKDMLARSETAQNVKPCWQMAASKRGCQGPVPAYSQRKKKTKTPIYYIHTQIYLISTLTTFILYLFSCCWMYCT